jgi:hypothetical protein
MTPMPPPLLVHTQQSGASLIVAGQKLDASDRDPFLGDELFEFGESSSALPAASRYRRDCSRSSAGVMSMTSPKPRAL